MRRSSIIGSVVGMLSWAAIATAQVCAPQPSGPLKFQGVEGQWLVPDHRLTEDNINARWVPSWYVPPGMIFEVANVAVNSNRTPFADYTHMGIVRISPHPTIPGARWSFGAGKEADVYAEPLLSWEPNKLILHEGERLAVRASAVPLPGTFLQFIMWGYLYPAECLAAVKGIR